MPIQTLTINDQQLLFVKVPIESVQYRLVNKESLKTAIIVMIDLYHNYPLIIPNGNYGLLGTIQKENGNVSTTIEGMPDYPGIMFIANLELEGIELNEGDKYVVLKIK